MSLTIKIIKSSVLGFDTTLTISYNTVIESNLNVLVTFGILFVFGATGKLLIMNLRKISAIFFTNAVTIIDRKANCEHCQKMPNHVGYNFGIFLYIE